MRADPESKPVKNQDPLDWLLTDPDRPGAADRARLPRRPPDRAWKHETRPPLTERELDPPDPRARQPCSAGAATTSGSPTTPPQGSPTKFLLRPPRLIIAELKSEKGKARSPPRSTGSTTSPQIPTLEVCLWRPSMIDAIALYLQATDPP